MPISLIGKLLGFTGLPQWALELLAIGAIAGGIWYWHHSTLEQGIAEGVAKRDSYYQPLLQAAQTAKAAAESRNRQLQADQATVSKDTEEHHVQDIQTVTARAVDAERRIAELLRQRTAADSPAGSCPVSAVSGSADSGSAAGDGHDATTAGGPGSRLAADAAQCEHDADELALWLDWYKRQAALMPQPQSANLDAKRRHPGALGGQ